MKTYAKMKKREAAEGLHEFLEERPRALEHLTRHLAVRSEGTVTLDGTADSDAPAGPSWLPSTSMSFINQIMRGRLDVREIEEIGDNTLNFAAWNVPTTATWSL